METVVIRKAILNAVAASGANVADVAADGAYPGAVVVCENKTANPLKEFLPPITKGTCMGATKQGSQVEVVQIGVLGLDEETITASTRYKIELGNFQEKYESHSKLLGVYAYTSPAILSGNAQTDRENVYTVLKSKINSDSHNNVTAYLLKKVAFTTGSTALPQVGEVFTQATSNATVKLAAIEVTSGTITGGDAAGTAYFYELTGTWSANALVSTGGTSGGKITTHAALSVSGLVIVDDAGYYPAYPGTRKGKSSLYATTGFDDAKFDVGVRSTDTTLAVGGTGWLRGRDALYSMGIGSRMLSDVPSFTEDKNKKVSGSAGFILNALPDASKTYTRFRISVNVNPTDNVLTHYGKIGPYVYELWADESNSTNLNNFESALENALGVTIA